MQAVCAWAEDAADQEAKRIICCAHVLLAEVCVVTAPSATNRIDRKLWHRRLARAEQCIYATEQQADASLLSVRL